jgi:hypothetical protein
VFGRDSSGWEARQTLPGAPGDEEQFGYSLAAAGSRLLVGAPEALGSTVVPPRGAVYGYSFDDAGGDWELETTTLISPNQDSLRLGRSVDVAGPVAAAAAQEGQFTDKNAAYVFVRGMTGWTFSTSFLGAQAATPVVATSGGFVALGLDRGTAGGVLVRFVDDRIDPSALPLRDSNRFLRFFNSDALGFREDFATGEAYYATIDPNALKTTLAAWRTANGFDLGADAEAVYQNDADLNFGRRIIPRWSRRSSAKTSSPPCAWSTRRRRTISRGRSSRSSTSSTTRGTERRSPTSISAAQRPYPVSATCATEALRVRFCPTESTTSGETRGPASFPGT